MQSKKSHSVTCVVLGIVLSFWMMSLSGAVSGQEQELKTLKLVNTYQSEADIQSAYPDLFPSQAIKDEGEYITFSDQQTRQRVKQFQKKSLQLLREEKAGDDTIIWEKSYRYQISEDQAFLLVTEWEGGRLKSGIADPAELRGKPIKRLLFNDTGEEITQLDPYMNIVTLSPDKQHFLAMGADEVVLPFVYLYSIDGRLLKTFEFEGGGSASFSENGAFIEARSKKQFFIFSKTGELIYESEYANLKGFMHGYTAFFISDTGALFLMDTSGTLILFSIKNEVLWEVPSSAALNCYIANEEKLIFLLTLSEKHGVAKHDIYQVDIRSLETGELLERIEGVSIDTRFTKETIFIHQGGQFYEYHLQK